ncbi:hypothetical protein BsWGS_28483 [Bradybaena similaris]
MRLTVCLSAGLKDVTVRRWNKVWRCRGRFYDYPPAVPQALRDHGVEIVEMNQIKPVMQKWKPPVDDPRFAEPVPAEKLPDWHAEPVFTHSSNIRLFEGAKQACLIANAQHFEGFPPAVDRLIGAVEVPNKELRLQRAIMLSQVWNTDETVLPKRFDPRKPRWSWGRRLGITNLKSSQILMRDILRLSRSQVAEYPSLRHQLQATDLLLHSHVNYRGTPIVMKESLDLLLMSDQTLPPFAGQDMVQASAEHRLPDMWPVLPTVDFVQSNQYQLNSHTGLASCNTLTCPHTVVQFPRKYHWEDKHYTASQIMTCLMLTAAQARHRYGENVKVLPEPISIQHVLLEQDHFLFTFFQLNTLDLDAGTGIKNLVWTTQRSQLFEKILGQPWMPQALRPDRYLSFNPSAFDQFLAVYFNGVPEISANRHLTVES